MKIASTVSMLTIGICPVLKVLTVEWPWNHWFWVTVPPPSVAPQGLTTCLWLNPVPPWPNQKYLRVLCLKELWHFYPYFRQVMYLQCKTITLPLFLANVLKLQLPEYVLHIPLCIVLLTGSCVPLLLKLQIW